MNIDKEFPKGLLRPELFMGVLSSVAAYSVKVNLNDAGAPSGSHFSGSRYGKGEVGEFVLIEGQLNLLLGRIIEVNLPESERKGVTPRYDGTPALDALGSIQLLGTVCMESLRVTAGIEAYPRLGDRVYAAPVKFVSKIPTLMEKTQEEDQVALSIGSIDVGFDSADSRVQIRPEKLFGRHCAILGATGGGKSWTTAKLIEECLKYNCKIVLLDATGEYRKFAGANILNTHLGTVPQARLANESIESSLPPSMQTESDFIAMFKPSPGVQAPKFREALVSLRMTFKDPAISENGFLKKMFRPYTDLDALIVRKDLAEVAQNPAAPINIHKLVGQIKHECVYENETQYGKLNDQTWGYCQTLITRITTIISSKHFSFMFNAPDKQPLSDLFAKFFLNNNCNLLRVCLSGISFEYQCREIVANAIGRYLLNRAREGGFVDNSLLLVVDEAHNFLGRNIGTEDSVSKLDAFELIAKEGRKYGLNICLATQRPRDITESVLSQMGTLLVHRLTNDKDREVVGKACGEIDRASSAFLPNLKPGEAAIIGTDFPIPLTLQIRRPTIKPLSDGPNYQKHWK